MTTTKVKSTTSTTTGDPPVGKSKFTLVSKHDEEQQARAKRNKESIALQAAAWGWNSERRDGNLTAVSIPFPRQLQRTKDFCFISGAAGKHHALLVTNTGNVYSIGDGRQGQLGYGNIFTGLPAKGGETQATPRHVTPSGVLKFGRDLQCVEVAAGGSFSVAREINHLEASQNVRGFLSLEAVLSYYLQLFPDSPAVRAAYSVVRQERCVINRRAEGKVLVWGTGPDGELGLGEDQRFSSFPVLNYTLHRVVVRQVAAGPRHCLAVTTDGHLYSWGRGQSGRLGHGDFEDRHEPTVVAFTLSMHVVWVAAGDAHSAVLTAPRDDPFSIAQQPVSAVHAASIYAPRDAAYRSLLAGVTRKVLCFGRGAHGRLGHGTNRNSATPVLVKALPPSVAGAQVVAVACGGAHTLALLHQLVAPSLVAPGGVRSHVVAWGYGANGQLGTGYDDDSFAPLRVRLPKAELVLQVAAGRSWSLARAESGRVFSWGKGLRGQLGQGAARSFSLAPRETAATLGDAHVLHVSSGYAHNVAIYVARHRRLLDADSAEAAADAAHGDGAAAADDAASLASQASATKKAAISSFATTKRWLRGPLQPSLAAVAPLRPPGGLSLVQTTSEALRRRSAALGARRCVARRRRRRIADASPARGRRCHRRGGRGGDVRALAAGGPPLALRGLRRARRLRHVRAAVPPRPPAAAARPATTARHPLHRDEAAGAAADDAAGGDAAGSVAWSAKDAHVALARAALRRWETAQRQAAATPTARVWLPQRLRLSELADELAAVALDASDAKAQRRVHETRALRHAARARLFKALDPALPYTVDDPRRLARVSIFVSGGGDAAAPSAAAVPAALAASMKLRAAGAAAVPGASAEVQRAAARWTALSGSCRGGTRSVARPVPPTHLSHPAHAPETHFAEMAYRRPAATATATATATAAASSSLRANSLHVHRALFHRIDTRHADAADLDAAAAAARHGGHHANRVVAFLAAMDTRDLDAGARLLLQLQQRHRATLQRDRAQRVRFETLQRQTRGRSHSPPPSRGAAAAAAAGAAPARHRRTRSLPPPPRPHAAQLAAQAAAQRLRVGRRSGAGGRGASVAAGGHPLLSSLLTSASVQLAAGGAGPATGAGRARRDGRRAARAAASRLQRGGRRVSGAAVLPPRRAADAGARRRRRRAAQAACLEALHHAADATHAASPLRCLEALRSGDAAAWAAATGSLKAPRPATPTPTVTGSQRRHEKLRGAATHLQRQLLQAQQLATVAVPDLAAQARDADLVADWRDWLARQAPAKAPRGAAAAATAALQAAQAQLPSWWASPAAVRWAAVDAFVAAQRPPPPPQPQPQPSQASRWLVACHCSLFAMGGVLRAADGYLVPPAAKRHCGGGSGDGGGDAACRLLPAVGETVAEHRVALGDAAFDEDADFYAPWAAFVAAHAPMNTLHPLAVAAAAAGGDAADAARATTERRARHSVALQQSMKSLFDVALSGKSKRHRQRFGGSAASVASLATFAAAGDGDDADDDGNGGGGFETGGAAGGGRSDRFAAGDALVQRQARALKTKLLAAAHPLVYAQAAHDAALDAAAVTLQRSARGLVQRLRYRRQLQRHIVVRRAVCARYWHAQVLGAVFDTVAREVQRAREAREAEEMAFEDALTQRFTRYQRTQAALMGFEALAFGVRALVGRATILVPCVDAAGAPLQWAPSFCVTLDALRDLLLRRPPLRRLFTAPQWAAIAQFYPRWADAAHLREQRAFLSDGDVARCVSRFVVTKTRTALRCDALLLREAAARRAADERRRAVEALARRHETPLQRAQRQLLAAARAAAGAAGRDEGFVGYRAPGRCLWKDAMVAAARLLPPLDVDELVYATQPPLTAANAAGDAPGVRLPPLPTHAKTSALLAEAQRERERVAAALQQRWARDHPATAQRQRLATLKQTARNRGGSRPGTGAAAATRPPTSTSTRSAATTTMTSSRPATGAASTRPTTAATGTSDSRPPTAASAAAAAAAQRRSGGGAAGAGAVSLSVRRGARTDVVSDAALRRVPTHRDAAALALPAPQRRRPDAALRARRRGAEDDSRSRVSETVGVAGAGVPRAAPRFWRLEDVFDGPAAAAAATGGARRPPAAAAAAKTPAEAAAAKAASAMATLFGLVDEDDGDGGGDGARRRGDAAAPAAARHRDAAERRERQLDEHRAALALRLQQQQQALQAAQQAQQAQPQRRGGRRSTAAAGGGAASSSSSSAAASASRPSHDAVAAAAALLASVAPPPVNLLAASLPVPPPLVQAHAQRRTEVANSLSLFALRGAALVEVRDLVAAWAALPVDGAAFANRRVYVHAQFRAALPAAPPLARRPPERYARQLELQLAYRDAAQDALLDALAECALPRRRRSFDAAEARDAADGDLLGDAPAAARGTRQRRRRRPVTGAALRADAIELQERLLAAGFVAQAAAAKDAARVAETQRRQAARARRQAAQLAADDADELRQSVRLARQATRRRFLARRRELRAWRDAFRLGGGGVDAWLAAEAERAAAAAAATDDGDGGDGDDDAAAAAGASDATATLSKAAQRREEAKRKRNVLARHKISLERSQGKARADASQATSSSRPSAAAAASTATATATLATFASDEAAVWQEHVYAGDGGASQRFFYHPATGASVWTLAEAQAAAGDALQLERQYYDE
eukprot:gene8235-5936_t